MRIEAGTKVLITGASRGIGRALAVAFAERGARVGLMARSEDELNSLAGEIGGDAVVLPADVGDRQAVETAVERFISEAGGLDVVVANAGIAKYDAFKDLDLERAEAMTRINYLGTLYTVKAALPHLLGQRSGQVVIVSSAAAYRAFPSASVYGGTKAAQKGFAEALRHELDGTGVSVTTVLPGEIKTDLHAHERDQMPVWYRSERAVGPEKLAAAVLDGIEKDRRAVNYPPVVRLLGLNGIVPGFADWLLRRLRGTAVAPRKG